MEQIRSLCAFRNVSVADYSRVLYGLQVIPSVIRWRKEYAVVYGAIEGFVGVEVAETRK